MAKQAEISLGKGFEFGMYVEAVYNNPTGSGRIEFNLMQDDDNILLHFNPRFDAQRLILNSKRNGKWEEEEMPKGYDFSLGAKTIVKIQAYNKAFTIYIDGKQFYLFNYRPGMSFTDIKKVQFDFARGAERVASKLQSLQIGYV